MKLPPVLALLLDLPEVHDLLDILHLLGAGVCGQVPSHSFVIGGRRLPLCARCTGIYLGFLLGLAAMAIAGRGRASSLPPTRVLALLAGFVALMGLDGLNSYLDLLGLPHLYEPHNALRLATGVLCGLALSAIVCPIFNLTLWKAASKERAIRNCKEVGLLLAPAAPLIWIVQAGVGPLLYPIAISSILGVLAALTTVNAVLVLILTRRQGRATSWRHALPPLGLGLMAAFLELAVMGALHRALIRALASAL
ncbi:MAG TPA: DUF2085 domain-containing protein [Anaerolineae bacterium]|nr:DUF2085 domain-containing protein [Anaerolineae bacterium]